MNNKIKQLVEKLAAIEHQRWAFWHENWERQMKTNYKDLSEIEKEFDRRQVFKTLKVIAEFGYDIFIQELTDYLEEIDHD